MSAKLKEITPQYSTFVDDQVLTSSKLNEFIEYFDEQDRLSRICLTGVGLVCGFRVTQRLNEDGEPIIDITQGCGVTTDGDLVKLQQDSEEEPEGNPGSSFKDTKDIVLSELSYSHYRDFLDADAEYDHFKNGGSTINLKELIVEGEEDESAGDKKLDDGIDLTNKVVILYLESYAKKADICTGSNCDNQGQPNIQKVRVLLVNKNDVETVINAKDPIYTKYNLYEAMIGLTKTAVPRFVLNPSFGPANNIATFDKMAKAYQNVITTTKTSLHSAYSELFSGFADVLGVSSGTANVVLSQIDDLDDFSSPIRVQYRYNLLQDLSATYNELSELLLKLRTECCPNILSFPKHLLLGRLQPEEIYPELRHEFYHSPVNNNYSEYLEQAKSLVNRIVLLLDSFSLNNTQDIRITPSVNCGDLGQKAIPSYFTVDNALLSAWNFRKTENYKQKFNLSYHRDNLNSAAWVQEPLDYLLDCHELYRIEGHLNLDADIATNQIESIKESHALDFDFKTFDLQENGDAFTAFVKDHPSLEHKAGVPRSGTFVLVTEKDSAVADFCLPYKIATRGNEQGCCSLMECTYPWISSLKYMNNLARSLKGTQSRNKPMPKNYRIQIVEYRINGERLINGTVIVSVPLSQVFLRRMHAVTDALNQRFPEGVVFDFNESQKRFVITRAKEDSYVIRLRDITQAVNNPVYTYSNTGMYRNNKVFRPDAMRCRDLKSYNPEFYKKLHEQIAPVNKDDDYGTYDEKWRKWYELRDRLVNNPDITGAGLTRYITETGEFPPEIRGEMDRMIRDFNNVNPDGNRLTFRVDGDWVNGVWVNEFMLDHHRANSKNTHDDIVLFVNLRKFLHNETGVTKLSVYITGIDYDPAFDAVIAQYDTFADFYFGVPSGENAITL